MRSPLLSPSTDSKKLDGKLTDNVLPVDTSSTNIIDHENAESNGSIGVVPVWPVPNSRLIFGIYHPPGALYSFFILSLINLINFIDRYVPSATKADIQESFDLNDFWSSFPLTSFIIVYTLENGDLMCPVFGYLADLGYSRRLIICCGVIAWSIFTALGAACPNFATFLLVRSLVGIGEASYATIAPAIISDYYRPEDRAKMLGVFYLGIPVGAALGFALGGVLGDAFGWRIAFIAVGVPGIGLGVLMMTTVDPVRGSKDPVPIDSHQVILAETQLQVLSALLSNPIFLVMVIGLTFSTFGAGGMADWFPSYLHRVQGMSVSNAGLAVGGVVIVGGLVGAVSGPLIADAFKGKVKNAYLFTAGLSSLLAALFAILVIILDEPIGLIIFLLALTQISLWMYIGPITAVTANCVLPRHRTRAFALATLCQHALGDAASPTIIGKISDETSLHFAASLIPIVFLAAGAVWLPGSHWLPDIDTTTPNAQLIQDDVEESLTGETGKKPTRSSSTSTLTEGEIAEGL